MDRSPSCKFTLDISSLGGNIDYRYKDILSNLPELRFFFISVLFYCTIFLLQSMFI